MRVRVDDVSFLPISALEDGTNYKYRSKAPRAEFSLEFELPAGGGTPAKDALADIRGQHVDYLGDKFSVDEQGELTLVGQPAPFMRYHFPDRGTTQYGLLAFANLGSEAGERDWVKLAWLHEGPEPALRELVDAVVASFAKASDPPPAPTPTGWTRRYAGRWAFDLPDYFLGPRSFVWNDIDAELRILLTVHPDGAEKPELEARVAAYTKRGMTIVEREDEPITYGQLARLRLRDRHDREWFACPVVQGYEVGDPVRLCWVETGAQGPWTAQAQVRDFLDQLLASISVGGHQ